MQLGSWATHDNARAVRDDRAHTVMMVSRNFAVAAAFAMVAVLCLRSILAAPADQVAFPVAGPPPVSGALPLTLPAPASMQTPAAETSTPETPAAPVAPTAPTPQQPPHLPSVEAPMPTPAAPVAVPPLVPALQQVDADKPHTVAIRAMTTGYCPCEICCGPGAEGITSIRRDVHRHPRGIAIDPALIPYRTMLTVPGYGTAMADDTGGAMRHDGDAGVVHLDLRFRTHAQAKAWGVRWLTVEVPDSTLAASLGTPAAEIPAQAAPAEAAATVADADPH